MKKLNTFAKLGLATTMAFGTIAPVAAMITPIHAAEEEAQPAGMIDTHNIENLNVQLDGELKYTGQTLTQKVVIIDEGYVLQEGKDYVLEGNENVEAGAYTLRVKGINNYHGEKEVAYVITRPSTEKVNVCNFNVALVNSLKDNGTDQVQQIRVTFGDEVVTEGVDYTVTGNVARNAGAYNLTIHGMGRFVGDLDVPYIVAGVSHDQVNIANTKIVLANSLTANGQAQAQKVRITCGDVVLKEGTDYTLSNNVAKDAGTYTMTVSGKGQYVGSVQVNYTIAKAVTPTPAPEKKEEKKQEKKDDVKTGEQTNVGFFAAMAALALAAMGAIIAILNKKRA